MRKLMVLIGIQNKRNFQNYSLFVVYLCIMLIAATVVGVIGAFAIIGPYLKTAGANSQTASYYLSMLCYALMVCVAGICFDVMFSVPFAKDQYNGNVEAMLAASVSPKSLWRSKSLALFLPSVIVSYVAVVAMALILKTKYFTGGIELRFSPWLTVTTFIIVPLVYLVLCFLMNLIGLNYGVEGGMVLGTILGPCYATLFINIGARKTLDPQGFGFLAANAAVGVVLLILCLVLQRRLDKERIVLLCRR